MSHTPSAAPRLRPPSKWLLLLEARALPELGAYFAKAEPDAVRQVITLGSPFTGDPLASNAVALYRRLSGQRPQIELRWLSLREPPPVPTTSIYSRSDGIVAWPCCINTPGPQVENLAIEASHCGLGHHPVALYSIADRLAQAEGVWQPFRRDGLRRFLYGSHTHAAARA